MENDWVMKFFSINYKVNKRALLYFKIEVLPKYLCYKYFNSLLFQLYSTLNRKCDSTVVDTCLKSISTYIYRYSLRNHMKE